MIHYFVHISKKTIFQEQVFKANLHIKQEAKLYEFLNLINNFIGCHSDKKYENIFEEY